MCCENEANEANEENEENEEPLKHGTHCCVLFVYFVCVSLEQIEYHDIIFVYGRFLGDFSRARSARCANNENAVRKK